MSLLKCAIVFGILSMAIIATSADAEVPLRQRKGGEYRMEVAARHVPGFAGLYYDEEGELTVSLVGELGAGAARQHFGADVRLESAKYTFSRLQGWRDRVRAILLLPNVVYVDLDEQENRIVVAIDEPSRDEELTAVAAEIASYGLPADAILIERTEAARQLALLTDNIQPQPSGVKVPVTSSKSCTLGFNVAFEAGAGFITCAHCTDVQGQVDGDYIGWGHEVRDAPYWAGGPCPSGKWGCRYSDSALMHYFTVAEQGAG